MQEKKPRYIQSVKRAMDIINCFDPLHPQLSLSEISKKLNLNISTVHGIINTLCAYSYIDKNPDNGKYRLGLEFLVKSNIVSATLDLKEIGQPYLVQLTKKHQETAHLNVFQNDQIFCVAKTESPNSYSIVSSRAGNKLPLHASASGKLFLASLEPSVLDQFFKNYSFEKLTDKTLISKEQILDCLSAIRASGFSIEDEEIEHGAFSIAAPVLDAEHHLVGTISIIGSKVRIKEKEEAILADLLDAASSISKQFGYQS